MNDDVVDDGVDDGGGAFSSLPSSMFSPPSSTPCDCGTGVAGERGLSIMSLFIEFKGNSSSESESNSSTTVVRVVNEKGAALLIATGLWTILGRKPGSGGVVISLGLLLISNGPIIKEKRRKTTEEEEEKEKGLGGHDGNIKK